MVQPNVARTKGAIAPSGTGSGADGAGAAALLKPRELALALKEEARRLGFVAAGIATAEPFVDLAGLLWRRQRAGRSTPWEDPDPERRTDPAALLPGARSLVAVAMPYPPPGRPPRPAARATEPASTATAGNPLRGFVAAAGRTRSYQHFMRQRLEELGRWLERHRPGCRWAVQVDTGPLVDRAVAERAGIGWIGKNCCLIVPGHGSWVFLGELVTDVELPADEPLADACADCDLCLRACPTRAFTGPRELDPRRCVSFLTQAKGPLSDQERQAVGVSLYGCDACQAVCPHNRHGAGAEAVPPGLMPSDPEEAAAPPLLELLTMSQSEFRRRYRALTGAWRGRKTWQRNAIIALGNRRDPAAVPPLRRVLLGDRRPELRAPRGG
ncbi:MAG: tRNA epoxyqueuosine(34) reductase QueG, partial [Bacillota bacterium]